MFIKSKYYPFLAAVALFGAYSNDAFAQIDAGTYSCTPADINQALETDLSCDTTGTVVFGTDVTEFIVSHCGGLSAPGEAQNAKRQAEGACMRCARKAADAFRSAVKANLIQTNAGGLRPSVDKIRSLCKLPDDGDGEGEGEGEKGSPAMQSLISQVKLCFPQEGQTIDPATCSQCAQTVLDNALSAGVITQAKYTVFKQSVTKACNNHDGSSGGEGKGENEEGGNKGVATPTGELRPTPPSGEPRPTPPAPSGTPAAAPTPAFGNMDPFFSALRSCVSQFRGQLDQCMSCVKSVSTDGLDPARVAKALETASSACSGSFEPPK